jgi:ATP-dependent helicase/nuclease subunit A
MTTQPTLFDRFDEPPGSVAAPPDQAARDFAIDPTNHVVLEASAGTGKTRVLVDRYVRLLESGVDPRHILAMTFTRKAAAEMRERVVSTLRRSAQSGAFRPDVWKKIQTRMGDIQITTIDGFCFGLLREFPLEADVDPAFEVADETEMARFASEALDVTLRTARMLIEHDEHIRLLFVRVKQPVLREAIAMLIDRRQVSLPAVAAFVGRGTEPATAAAASHRFLMRLWADVGPSPDTALVDDGPHGLPEFARLAADLGALDAVPADDPVRVPQLRRRLEQYFLTKDGKPRLRLIRAASAEHFASPAHRKRHEQAVARLSPQILAAVQAFEADLNHLLARGLLRVLVMAVENYERLLEEHALLDFAGMLHRAVELLEQQEEFARSRLKLQSRYHHLLIDEFQDTSRRQWRLIELLIDAWAEGEGAADAATSVFVVGDRKQSVYRFRHAEVTLLDAAATRISALRPTRVVRQAISTSFRAVPELLAFVNALSAGLESGHDLDERWRYGETDQFPAPAVGPGARRDGQPVLGLIAEPSMEASAAAVAEQIVQLLERAMVRDRATGVRPARPDDIAILFRARAGHQYFEEALESRGVRTYVYKGLGFFDAPEVQDLQALLHFLARPESDLAAAAFLRSRFVRLSDPALAMLAPSFAARLRQIQPSADESTLTPADGGLLARTRTDVRRWLALAAAVPPSELVDVVIRESAYAFELGGRRLGQARENIKKVRALVRRVENRGYVTLDRLAAYFDTLGAGDDSNAIVEAAGAVNLMTIHAAKGLEFPIVFIVNLHAAGRGRPAGFSVIESGPDQRPEVAFSATAGTALEELREGEELRRLLYVAATRARDRLYLAAEVDRQERLRRGPRSLGALLPASLGALFAAARTSTADELEWVTERGSFAFAVCRASGLPPVWHDDAVAPDPPRLSIEPVQSAARRTVSATSVLLVAPQPDADRERRSGADARGARLVGTLVHRMFQRKLEPAMPDDLLREQVRRLIGIVERVDVPDVTSTVEAAMGLYRSVRAQPAVAELLDAGRCYYEVPFSYLAPESDGQIVRGAVDCLVVASDGRATILEFKTGHPRPEHQAQIALYARAMESALGQGPVMTRICYP